MGMMDLCREELKAMARALDQEGLSQTAIGKELGVARRTISDWLSGDGCHHTEAEIANIPQSGDNRLAVARGRMVLGGCNSYVTGGCNGNPLQIGV